MFIYFMCLILAYFLTNDLLFKSLIFCHFRLSPFCFGKDISKRGRKLWSMAVKLMHQCDVHGKSEKPSSGDWECRCKARSDCQKEQSDKKRDIIGGLQCINPSNTFWEWECSGALIYRDVESSVMVRSFIILWLDTWDLLLIHFLWILLINISVVRTY